MKINKKVILLVQVINFLILAKINNAISSSSSRNSHTEDLLDRIALNNNNNDKSFIKYGGQDEINKNVARFLNRIIPTFTTTQKDNACNSKVLQSNVQSKMRTLRSIISSCPGYCRLAMSLNGRLYGSRNDFGLETIWERIDASQAQFSTINNLGSYYIKFILSYKYLCINKDGNLFASTFENNECLWVNEMSRIKSAKYLHLNIVINKKCDLNFKTSPSIYSTNYEAFQQADEENEKCKGNVTVTSGFSPDLQNFFRNCQARVRQQQQANAENHPVYTINKPPKLEFKNKNKVLSQNELVANDKPTMAINQKFRKCFKYRKTGNYRKCMKKYYKCFQFNKDVEKLKKCRNKFGIRPISLRDNRQSTMFYS